MIAGFLLLALIGYLAGSLTPSIWIGKLVYKKDIRQIGSGNAGATNVYRTLGWRPALAVMAIDISKGFLPTWFAASLWIGPPDVDVVYLQLLAGIMAVLGHCYTLFGGFRGGKGVATAGGMMIALFPIVIPFCILVFVVVVWLTRYVSLASICTAISLPIALFTARYGFDRPLATPLLILGIGIAVFIVFTHRSNVKRLLAGSESKIGSSGSKD